MLRKILIKTIQALLWLIDKDHRVKEEIGMDDVKKFTHVVPQNFKSDFGTVKNAFRTVPYELWELKTETKTLLAADKHRVIRDDHSCAWLEDLKAGDLIKTDNGLERVVSSRSLGIRTHMYCVQVETDDPLDPNNHLFYTDGILSHNTTTAAGYLLWRAMFVPDTQILIAANKFSQAMEIMDRIRYSYEECPNYIRAGVTEYNKGTITFDNGSSITARATTPDAGRGLSISLLYLDEFAFVRPNMASEFWTSIQPVLSTGGGCIITSTPKNDEDQFAQIWRGANDNTDEYGNPLPMGEGSNGFFPVKVTWDKHPDRDEAWAAPFRSSLGVARFSQEFECEFVSDDETLIEAMTLARLKYTEPVSFTGTVRWFKDPEPNKTYMLGLDPALGTGGDYAAIQVFELPGLTQVAEWQHNKTAPKGQIKTLLQILTTIDQELRAHPDQVGDPAIYWTVENNSIGEAALVIIEDTGEHNFPGTFVSEKRRPGAARRRKGMNTSNSSKLAACAKFKSLLETDRMKVNSRELVRQLKNFVGSGASYAAKPGEKDDLVMSAMLIIRMLETVINWIPAEESDELRDGIDTDDLFSEPMPILIG